MNVDLLIFDWDGTAVPDRDTMIPDLLNALEVALGEAGLTCVIMTGTNVDHLLSQGIEKLSQGAKTKLYLCTNRGSEVWGFDARGDLHIQFRREAMPAENIALDQAVSSIQNDLASKGLKTAIIANRLNRRKLDLIPEPKWAKPKKTEFRELLQEVTDRLRTAGVAGGLKALIEDAHRMSKAAGLSIPRITSDIKHIEIGLTDKADSVKWIFENLIQPRQIPLANVAVLGDEFGSIGGIQGSDALLRIPELFDATYISVGVEPEGVPSFVEHRGRGPSTLLEFLHQLSAARQAAKAQPEEDSLAWQVTQEGFEPSRERDMETLFAIGNGYLGVRATADFPAPTAQPDLLIAGIYDRKAAGLPYSEVAFLSTDDRNSTEAEIVPFPSPFQYQFRLGGNPLSVHSNMNIHTRTLNLKDGLYHEEHGFEDASGRKTKVQSMRCALLDDPHFLVQRIRIQAENYTDVFEIDFTTVVEHQALLYPHLLLPNREEMGPYSVVYRTRGSKIECAMVSKVFVQETEVASPVSRVEVTPNKAIEILRLICVFTSRESKEPLYEARRYLANMTSSSICSSVQTHSQAWHKFWLSADVTFQDQIELTQAQRFNLYHLRIAANDDSKVSIPAKALTGRAYEGHVFWDAEIFMLPFFLYTAPHIAKNLLLYRYYTLVGARKRAKEMGYRGACYAWESTVSGEDVTPKSIVIGGKDVIPIYTGTEQIHVTADVAYALWKYWDATLDTDFLCKYAAEIFVETARFWASRVSKPTAPDDESYHILGVVGPDEYHHGVNDNAFTNWMARFNLEKASWVISYLQDKFSVAYDWLATRLSILEGEPANWTHVARNLFVPKPNKDGVIEQFQGFHALGKTQVSEQERNRAPISRLFNWREINKLQLVKQADVLMIPFLFPDALSQEVVAANYHYYEPRTDHGSSLSLCVHAAIAAQIGLARQAQKDWGTSLNFDLENAMANTALGIHAATIGGSWQALVFHMLGVRFTERGPIFQESLELSHAASFSEVTLKLRYRGRSYPVRIGTSRRFAA